MFIARQPIFNKTMKIYGYELLFRSSEQAQGFGNTSSLAATASVLGGLFEQGIDCVVGPAKAFVNFDDKFIMSDSIELINPKTLVIEVLETVKVNDELLNRLKELRSKGYTIALDDFEESFNHYPIVPIADIIKYDITVTPLHTIEGDVKEALLKNKTILAEKIETENEFKQALEMGFHLFQGYFFSKPKIVVNKKIKKSSKGQYMRIINELKVEEPSYDVITNIIKSDVNISYRVMRIISNKKEKESFDSIKKALVRMGLKELERWIYILMLQDLSNDKPEELMRLSLVRSKFSEQIAVYSKLANRKDEVSMMCLFSTLDAILDQPISEALEGLLITEDVYNALVYGEGTLKPICGLLLSYEKGEWVEVKKFADLIELNTDTLSIGYLNAISWASKVLE